MSVDQVRAEIEAVHAFFVEWFGGHIPADDAVFDKRLLARFDERAQLVQPGGQQLSLAELSAGMRRAHGASPDFRIAIRNVAVEREHGEWILATYEEWQVNAKNSKPPDNGRLSSVLFRRDDAAPGGLVWLHVHETWLPADVMAAGPYDF